jgi:DNA-directed RNA polymerase specialized sigma24 family protein
VTNYRVHGFDDVVIFVHDVETCLAKLDEGQQYLIKRIALQEYTYVETAGMMGLCVKTVTRRYARALDELTEIFLERKLLEPLKACQGVESGG